MPWSIVERDDRYCVTKEGESQPVPGGCHNNRPEAEAMMRALYATEGGRTAALADVFPLDPPVSWFTSLPDWFEPGMKLSVVTDGPEAGRVAGTVAPRGVFLLDGKAAFTAEDSPTGYEDAMQGDTVTAEGQVLKTSNLSADLNHVPIAATFGQAVDAMAHTGVALARVRYADVPGYGTVAIGAAWPGLDDTQVRKMQASALSGHWTWREEVGAYDMAGAIFVNNPGLPLPRRPVFQPRALAASLGLPHPPIVGAWLPAQEESPMAPTLTAGTAVATCSGCGGLVTVEARRGSGGVVTVNNPRPCSCVAANGHGPDGHPHPQTAPSHYEDEEPMQGQEEGAPVSRAEFDELLMRVEQLEVEHMAWMMEGVEEMAAAAALPAPPTGLAATICAPLDPVAAPAGT
jgi:hypothetical protein